MRKKSALITGIIMGFLISAWPGAADAMESRSSTNLKGIDVSHWDGTIHWNQVAASHIQFAYIKATGGNNFVDEQFSTNATNARRSGIAVGAYHYAKPTAPFRSGEPIQQANLFVQTMKRSMGSFGDIMPVLDLEETGGLSVRDLVQWIRVFDRTVEHQTNRQVMLYTSVDFIQRHSDLDNGLSNMPVWVAYYDRLNGGGTPPSIAGWSHWLIWQYSDNAHVSGLSGSTDLNAGPSSLTALRGDVLVERAAPNPATNVQAWPPILPSNASGVGQIGTPPAAQNKMASTHRDFWGLLGLAILLLGFTVRFCFVWAIRRKKADMRSTPNCSNQ